MWVVVCGGFGTYIEEFGKGKFVYLKLKIQWGYMQHLRLSTCCSAFEKIK